MIITTSEYSTVRLRVESGSSYRSIDYLGSPLTGICNQKHCFFSQNFIVNLKPKVAHLRIVFHDTAYLVHHVNAALAVKGIDQLCQVGVTVAYGPVLQSSVCPLVISRVAVGKGRHLSLGGTSQRLIHVNPLTANLCCHQLQDVNTYRMRGKVNLKDMHNTTLPMYYL